MVTLQDNPQYWHGAPYPQEVRCQEVILFSQEGTFLSLGDSLLSLWGALLVQPGLILKLSQGCFLLNLEDIYLALEGHILSLEDTELALEDLAQVHKDLPLSLEDTLLALAGLGCTLSMDAGIIPQISLLPLHPLLVSNTEILYFNCTLVQSMCQFIYFVQS